jgi:prevent-host-death family protein
MPERSIGIRELKARLSEYVRDVKRGATIIITEHGRRVARLVPEAHSLDERLEILKDAGVVQWSGRRLGAPRPAVPSQGKRTVASLVVENRK